MKKYTIKAAALLMGGLLSVQGVTAQTTVAAAESNVNKTIQKEKKGEKTLAEKLAQYAPVKLTTDISHLSKSEKEVLGILYDVADIMDGLYWKQFYGDKEALLKNLSPVEKEFALINYGPWDRMDNWRPFIKGIGEKTKGLNFYPKDMTDKEFKALKDPNKESQYSVIRRDKKGKLVVKGYYEEYRAELDKAIKLMEKAADITENDELRTYLLSRAEAFKTNDYFQSDMNWMDMKNSNLDFVVGPIENYDDEIYGIRTSFEAFVLVKDPVWSKNMSKYIALLPMLQKNLPCEDKYKQEVPGTDSDINVYDVLYYAGDCNAGGKTIAINLPNDEKVQLKKGSRRFQLKNAMQAKFDAIVVPIAKTVINPEQMALVNFDAFFSNVTFHEVAHGLGIKNTLNGSGSVRKALGSTYSAWEEAKADVLGLYMVSSLIDMGELKGITKEQSIVTYIAGLFRSVRFGAADAHGLANMMCFNFFENAGVFKRSDDGVYTVDFQKAEKAIAQWSSLILRMEGDGDMDKAASYLKDNAVIKPALQHDLNTINNMGIPVDVRFIQGKKVMGLE